MPTLSVRCFRQIDGDTARSVTRTLSWTGLPAGVNIRNVYISWSGWRSTGSGRGRIWHNTTGDVLGTFNEGAQSLYITSWYNPQGQTSGSVTLQFGAYHAAYVFNEVYLNIEYEEAISNPEVTAPNIAAGSRQTVTYTNSQMASCAHLFTWTCGYRSFQVSVATSSTTTRTLTQTIPLDWMYEFTNASSFVASLNVKAYRNATWGTSGNITGGDLAGETTVYFTVYAATSAAPTVSSLTISQASSAAYDMGIYVQGVSDLILTVSGISLDGCYGAALAYYEFSGAYTGTSKTAITRIGVLQSNGSLTFRARAVDTRGNASAWVTRSISAYAYSPPYSPDAAAYRCDRDGNADDAGTYICVSSSAIYTPLDGNNEVTLTYAYRERTNSAFYQAVALQGNTPTVFGGSLDPTKIYIVRVNIKDTMGSEWYVDMAVTTELYPLHIRDQGKGVAIGQVCQTDYSFEVAPNWEVYVKGHTLLDLIYPVGAVYISMQNVSPQTFFGGTWLALSDCVLAGAGPSHTAGSTGYIADGASGAAAPSFLIVYMWQRVQ